jgi:hypothetical protein
VQAQNRKNKLRDPDIRAVLLREIEKQFPDKAHDLILQEFGCKVARIDIAVVNGALHGFEIKSDCDSLERLAGQIAQYSRIFDYVTLVCGKKLFHAAIEEIPKWWGIQLAVEENSEVTIADIRLPIQNPSQNKMALARMLWKDEALKCLRQNGRKGVTSRQSAEEVWAEAAKRLDLRVLADAVRFAIKARGGSGFEKQLAQGDGSCTIESTALANHSSDLSWLLSLQSQRLPH